VVATLPELCAAVTPVDPAGLILCHRDLHPENVQADDSGLVIIDWDNFGAAMPGRELAQMLFDWYPDDLDAMGRLYRAYVAEAARPHHGPADFTMLIAARLNFLSLITWTALDRRSGERERAWAEREIEEMLPSCRPPASWPTCSAWSVVDDVDQVVAGVGRGVGQVPVVRADLAHRPALPEHDLQPVLGFPVALALHRDVHATIAVRLALHHDLRAHGDVVEDVVRTGDLDVPVPVLLGLDVGHDVTVVIEDGRRGGPQRGVVEGEERRDGGMDAGRIGIVVVAVDDDLTGRPESAPIGRGSLRYQPNSSSRVTGPSPGMSIRRLYCAAARPPGRSRRSG
jgi:hypothetical protein